MALVQGLAATRNPVFGLQDDYLVRPPDLSVNGLVDDKKDPFETLRTSTSNRTERMYQELHCDEPRYCELKQGPLPPLPPVNEVLSAGKDGRVFSYAVALAHYQRLTAHTGGSSPGEQLETITLLLNNFDVRRDKTYPSYEGNKQKLLPQLAAALMQAHARFVADRSADLGGYGEAIVAALQPKRKVTADELRLVGVSQAQLAQHLLATSFIEGETVKSLSDKFDKRLDLIGLSGGPVALFELGRSAASNPALMCIVGQVVAHASSKASSKSPPFERVAKACSQATISKELRDTNPDFWRRADLTDANFWRGSDSRRQQFPLEQYLPLIQQTAKRPEFAAAWSGDLESSPQGLRKTNSWTFLSGPIWFVPLLVVLGAITFAGRHVNRAARLERARADAAARLERARADRASRWERGRVRFNTPFAVDPARTE